MERIFRSYHVERFDISSKEEMDKLSRIVTDPNVIIESKQVTRGEAGFNAETGDMITTPDLVLLSYFREEEF